MAARSACTCGVKWPIFLHLCSTVFLMVEGQTARSGRRFSIQAQGQYLPTLTVLSPRLRISKQTFYLSSLLCGFPQNKKKNTQVSHSGSSRNLLRSFFKPLPSLSRGVSSGRPVSWSPPLECRVISFIFHHIAVVVCAPVVAACRLSERQLRCHEGQTPPLHLV